MSTGNIQFRIFDRTKQQMHDVIQISYFHGEIVSIAALNNNNHTIIEYKGHDQLKKCQIIRDTDFCDDNDTEIWEDDIVQIEFNHDLGKIETYHGIVTNEDNRYWTIDFPSYGRSLPLNWEMEPRIETIKVVGNIWENKELFDTNKMELLVK